MAERRIASGGPAGRVRIIGGTLRGSRLAVPAAPGLRPTSDRVRETLFNWLQPVLPGARCLDAFAGTGALGFEAASRGAGQVLMLERDPALAGNLRQEALRLRVPQVAVQCTDAIGWLSAAAAVQFDLVFLDPPFAAALLQPAIDALPRWLAPDARVYVECALDSVLDTGRLEPLREGRTREVRYALYRYPGNEPGGDRAAAG